MIYAIVAIALIAALPVVAVLWYFWPELIGAVRERMGRNGRRGA